MPEIQTSTPPVKTPLPATPQPPAEATPAPSNYTVPVPIPGDLMTRLIALSSDSGLSLSDLCLQLIQQAVNVRMLSEGTISDFSENAQEIMKTASMEAVLDALRIYNVPKMPATPGTDPDNPLNSGDIVFNTTSDVKDLISKLNAYRVTKGLAPLEKSICEVLYHYVLSLGSNMACADITGIPYNKFKAITKTLALNEREVNGVKSNVIDTGSIFSSYNLVDTPVNMDVAKPGADAVNK